MLQASRGECATIGALRDDLHARFAYTVHLQRIDCPGKINTRRGQVQVGIEAAKSYQHASTKETTGKVGTRAVK